MIQTQLNQWKTVLQRRVSSILLVAIIALTVTMPLIAPAAKTKSALEEALLENEPWIGDFDKMAKKRQVRVLVVFSKTFFFLDRGRQRGISHDLLSGVKELHVTGPAAPPITGIDDLAGKEIHVRKSSSYYESLVRLNEAFDKAGKSLMELVPAEEDFEDEDLLEMVNAGLIPMIVMDSHKAHFWTQIFDKIQVHADVAVRIGGEIAWAFRKNSPRPG